MIEYMEISNFMSHKETHLFFEPGVNVIIGPSDHGKSAIMRAVNWVVNNRPLGDSFRRHNTKSTTVGMLTSDADLIERSKGKDINSYFLNEDEIVAFGQGVPFEISTALNIKSINTQGQVDPHFMLSFSPGEVAAHFNEIAHLSKIDIGMKNLNSAKTKATKEKERYKAEVEDIKAELKQYKDLPTVEKEIEMIEQLQEEISELKSVKNELKQSLIIWKRLKQEIKSASWVKEAKKEVQSIETTAKEVESLKDKKYKTQEKLETIQEQQERLKQEREFLSKTKAELTKLNKQFTRLMPKTCPLCGSAT